MINSVELAQNLVSFLRYTHSVALPMLFLGMGFGNSGISKPSEKTSVQFALWPTYVTVRDRTDPAFGLRDTLPQAILHYRLHRKLSKQ